MAFEYDRKTDIRYQQGYAEGLREAREEILRPSIERLLSKKWLRLEQIADMFGIPLDDVLEIQKNLNLE